MKRKKYVINKFDKQQNKLIHFHTESSDEEEEICSEESEWFWPILKEHQEYIETVEAGPKIEVLMELLKLARSKDDKTFV